MRGNHRQARAAGGQIAGRDTRDRGGCRRGIRQVRRDVGAAAGAGAHIALSREAFVGEHDGLPRHADFLGHDARRRQSRAGRQGAGQDAEAEAIEHRLLAILVWDKHRGTTLLIRPIGT